MKQKEDSSGPRTNRFQTKRIHERPSASDGTRMLVGRLWPRGVTKKQATVHVWMKEIAPSPALRAWFGHAPARIEFRNQYAAELEANEAGVHQLASSAATGPVTLLYAARDDAHHHALVLAGSHAGAPNVEICGSASRDGTRPLHDQHPGHGPRPVALVCVEYPHGDTPPSKVMRRMFKTGINTDASGAHV